MLSLVRYSSQEKESWDDFVLNSSTNGTFLHTRKFLSYHGNRFVDRSFLLTDGKGRTLAVFPAAESPSDKKNIVTHPGITYGGLVTGQECYGEAVLYSMELISQAYKEDGYAKLLYKAIPYIYHRLPSSDDLYALFRLGAIRTRCDLSACIDQNHRGKVSSRRRRGIRKSIGHGVQIVAGVKYAPSLWKVLSSNLKKKHRCKPVHTIDEICQLHSWFPGEIQFVCAVLDGAVVAGAVLFITPTVVHAQYLASSETGNRVNALDVVIDHCIQSGIGTGKRFFDFGISNEDGGRVLNNGLYAYKHGFGARGVVHEFFEIDLDNGAW